MENYFPFVLYSGTKIELYLSGVNMPIHNLLTAMSNTNAEVPMNS